MRFGLFLLVSAAAVWGHHGLAGFDRTTTVRLEGVVNKLDWENPHVLIQLAVKDAGGAVTEWRVEGSSPRTLPRGLTRKSLAAGTELTVTGYRERGGKNILSATTMKLKDGMELALPDEGVFRPDLSLLSKSPVVVMPRVGNK